MSALIDHQWAFMQDVSKLIVWAHNNGFVLTGGELYRTLEQQKIYYANGASKTMQSNHLRRLAIDFNIFKDNALATLQEIEPLGKYWESLNPLNRWGGHFSTIKDGPHFERNAP